MLIHIPLNVAYRLHHQCVGREHILRITQTCSAASHIHAFLMIFQYSELFNVSYLPIGIRSYPQSEVSFWFDI